MKSSSYSEHRYRCCLHSDLVSDTNSCLKICYEVYILHFLSSVLVLWKDSCLRTNLNHCSSSLADRVSDLHLIPVVVWNIEPFIDIWQGLGRWDQPIARQMGEVLLNWFLLPCKAVTSLTYGYIKGSFWNKAEQFVRLHCPHLVDSNCGMKMSVSLSTALWSHV